MLTGKGCLMRQIPRKITYMLLTAAMLLSSAGCSGGSDAPAPALTEAVAAAVTETSATTEAPETSAAPETRETAGTSGEEQTSGEPDGTPPAETEELPAGEENSAPAAETAASSETAAPETTTTTTAETTTTKAPETTTTTAAETTTTAAVPATTSATTTATAPPETTTTTTTAAPKPASPSPPRISSVSSPGTSTFTAENIVFDYSNSGKGYVSVDYSGKTRLKLLLKLGTSQFDYDIYPGRGIQYITLAQGSGSYNVEIYEMLDNGKFINSVNESFTASIADEINMFTYRNFYVEFNENSACVAKASEVCAGCASDLDKIAAVFKYVTDNITYDKQKASSVTSGYIPDPDKVLAEKKGICFDYASLTAAMLRSQGVPTRLITGYANPNIYHAWNEVYVPNTGWITVEIMLDGTGFKRIDATFYASAANKQSFADYIANSSNYSNVYIY